MRKPAPLLALWLVRLRWLVILVWIAGVAWMVHTLPSIPTTATGSLVDLLPRKTPALRAEELSARDFAVPLLSRTMIVVRNPRGLSFARQAHLAELALRLSRGQLPAFADVAGALPLLSSIAGRPLAKHRATTALLYLFFRPLASSVLRTQTARRIINYEIGRQPGEFVGVTGEAPARVAEQAYIHTRLKWVELATFLLVGVAIAVRYRALGAAVMTLLAVALAYLFAQRIVGEVATASGIKVPSQAAPVLVVLVFGIATDYSIFFLSRFRASLADGLTSGEAAVAVLRRTVPIVVAAGITVAAGSAALMAAHLGFVRAFGPALAIAAVSAMVVAVTFVPAVLATGGARLFWPHRPRTATASPPMSTTRSERRGRLAGARVAARHPVLAVVAAVILIVAAASGLSRTAVANAMLSGLPHSSSVHVAYDAATAAFPAGVLAPVVVVVSGRGVGYHHSALAVLQRSLSRQGGAAQVLGPADPPPSTAGLALWQRPNAARFVLFLSEDPLSARAIAEVRRLKRRLPALVRSAGLPRARAMVAGDTAVSADVIDATLGDLWRVVPTILVAVFLVMALFLRALVAPVYLVATSVLAAAAALGLTTYVLQDLLGYGELTYYVLFTVVVLLLSLGSDYNVFLVGRIWQAARGRELPEAVADAGTRASRPIATAAAVLALSFALLVLVPLAAFREIAFAMVAGLLIDAFVVRSILVPALVVLVGARSAWPGRRLGRGSPPGPTA